MLNLMKLELKKHNFKGIMRGVIIANISITLFFAMIYYIEKDNFIPDYNELFLIIDTFVRITFVIFAAVLIAKLIIDEYKNKTISVLFTYPINRKKLIFSKLIMISGFTFFTILLSNIIIATIFIILESYNHYIPDILTTDLIVNQFSRMALQAVAASGICLIPLYFGMKKKSVPATIVSSIIIISILNSNNGGFSLSSIIIIPLALCAIGVGVAYVSIRNIENEDVL
ncbi:ABC transporter permease [Bacillus sp. SCS-151]|uniref:ABC transporter permease n=1 Tax=Nanhaiella sioensis TaxID=3115293 RepID=UPI00397D3558